MLSEATSKHGAQIELARKIGIPQATLNRWVSGERVPEYAGRKALMEALGIPMDAWDEPAEERTNCTAA